MISSDSTTLRRLATGLLAAAFAAGCSGGGEDGPAGGGEPPDPGDPWWLVAGPGQDLPVNDDDASRFLHQASFGPTSTEMTGLKIAQYL